MRTRTLALALAATLGLCLGSNARADLPIDVSNLGGTEIVFTGTSSPAGADINFTTTTVNGGQWGFGVTSNSPTDANLIGAIGGTFSYLTSAISTPVPGFETVNVTGTGTLTINDDLGLGTNLTGTINGFNLSDTVGSGGALNESATVNLSNVSYSGTNADLLALAAQSTKYGGVVTVTFQFTTTTSLTDLTSGTHETSWSGSITSTPEPSTMALAGLGALGLIGYGLRRRKAMGA